MPRFLIALREFGVAVDWLVMEIEDAEKQKRFFQLTKHLHNNIHGEAEPLRQWKPVWLPARDVATAASASAVAGTDGAAGAASATPASDAVAAFRQLYEVRDGWHGRASLFSMTAPPATAPLLGMSAGRRRGEHALISGALLPRHGRGAR